MKVIFAGSPAAAVPTIEALWGSEHDVVAVLTRPDSPQGRKRILTPTPVASFARDKNIPVIYASKIDGDVEAQIRNTGANIGVVVAYGALLPQSTLDVTEHGWLNLHFSELPQWRGAAPVQWQIMSGQPVAGSSVFQLVQELDAGPLCSVEHYDIFPGETSGELLERLSVLGAAQVRSVLSSIATGDQNFDTQVGESSYAPKLHLEDGHLRCSTSSSEVFNRYRAVTPEPSAWVSADGNRLKIVSAVHSPEVSAGQGTITTVGKNIYLGCASGSLQLLEVQPAGKQRMSAPDWFRGLHAESIEVN